ncbi:trans-sulfuration enzyme family protein [Basilea psittacipulmonis]|uniref:Cystathionine beta-lyase n=1 Tax=Basilea psittacipulmonis DSM 24701 TaxID=1072685 RepID=A0A077DF15_9BURK|nr:aminotransferase class I/II-fold pyridoxal phosphate-dependent enzyme [Basilea psittacipulmonis]AIL32027.1 hypothetical protein IX83_00625 [Basilea psittacipulmonis DSM 24701]
MKNNERKQSRSTKLTHMGLAVCDEQHTQSPVSVPVIRTSTVRFETVGRLHEFEQNKAKGQRTSVYGRYGLETRDVLEDLFCELEHGKRCFLASSGLNAISTALLSLVKSGDHIVFADGVYGPVRIFAKNMLTKLGVSYDFVNMENPDTLKQYIKPNTVGVYVEVPSSLFLRMNDLPAIAKIAHEKGLWVMADNSWGSGVAYRPLDLGADVSVIAGTKYANGHSDALVGAIVVNDNESLIKQIGAGHYALGTTISPDDAWLTTRGIRTIELRMKQQAAHAMTVIHALEKEPLVKRIYHPAYSQDPHHEYWKRDATGSNGLMSIALDLSDNQMEVFVNALSLFGIGYSWGGYECLIQWVDKDSAKVHACFEDDGCQIARLHIGLEDPEDVIADIQQALDKAKSV